jgi:vacuolar-type H+-ATPase subunit I/STV1
MKDKLIIFFKKYPLFLYLLPVFFVLHGFTENYDFVPPKDALVLVIVYMGFALVFLLLSWLFYKNWLKAAIIATFIMAFHFFFGSVQDMLRRLSPASVFFQ